MASSVFNIPFLQFSEGISEIEVNVSIDNSTYIFYLQNNVIENNLFLSVYAANYSPVYFASYRCCFGNYINKIDSGFPYLLFFKDMSKAAYQDITFFALNNGVRLYAQSR